MLRMPTKLLIVSLVLLAGCGAPEVTALPTIIPPQFSPTSTTAPSQQPSTMPSATPTTAAASPVAVPARTSVRADQLPLDQPWVLTSDALTAVGADGRLTNLVQPVITTIERAGQPPLLITRADDQSLALVDPETWSSHTLPLPAGTSVSGPFAWSPDHAEVAAIVFATAPADGVKTGNQVYRIDVQRGLARLVLDQFGGNPIYDPPEPVAWGPAGLLVRVQSSASSVFWQVDLRQAPATARAVLTIGDTGGWSIDDRGRFLVHRYFGQAPLVRDLAAGTEREIAGSTPLVAPDGTRIAYLSPRSDTSSGCCTLHIEPTDDRNGIITVLVLVALDSDAVRLAWTSDGARLLVVESASALAQAGGIENIGSGRLSVLRPDGTLVGSITPRNAESLRLTHDDHVLVVERGAPYSLEQIDLSTAALPTRTIELPASSMASVSRVVYAPPVPDTAAISSEPLQQYPDDAFGVTFAFPASWHKSSLAMDRYDGDTGFVTVGAGLNGGVWTIQSACEHESSHKLQPYGSAPSLEYVTIDQQPACLIWPSADQDPGFEDMAELVALPPHPITVAGTTYDFLIVSADKHHLPAIVSTVQFRRP